MNAPFPAPGGKIDESLPLKPVRVAVLTVSDTRDEESDTSGHILAGRVTGAGHALADRALVPDDRAAIRAKVMAWVASGEVDAIVTTGGTGLTGRDVTPEALEPLFDKRIDGFSVIFHQISYEKIGTSTLQSRACAGTAGGTYLFALPGSPGAVKDGWDGILKWQLDIRHRPCNFVEIMPRLTEK